MFSLRSMLGQIRQVLIFFTLALPISANASTVVSMQSSLGNINIQLFDETAPQTVANFLSYVNSGAYDNSFIHRSVPGFVVQGGGFNWDIDTLLPRKILTSAPVVNEFGASNLRGTIAMAKVAGNPNSATSQWFFNLSDNSRNLDSQNGGFTVFGQVIGDGMQVIDTIAGLSRVNLGGEFTSMPLVTPRVGDNYTAENLVMINKVQVVPIPAAGWLFGTVLLAIGGVLKRRTI